MIVPISSSSSLDSKIETYQTIGKILLL